MRIASESIPVVILAGGKSSRMGSDKTQLPHPKSGLPLLCHQLEMVAGIAGQTRIVSARTGQVLPPLPAGVIRIDDDGSAGPLGGIMAALSTVTGDHLMVVAVDLPYMDEEMLLQLVANCSSSHSGVYAQSPTGPEPLVSIVPTKLRPQLESALDRGDNSLRRLFTGPLAHVMKPVLFDRPEPFLNWNSPGDI